jgi:hypothetical protein
MHMAAVEGAYTLARIEHSVRVDARLWCDDGMEGDPGVGVEVDARGPVLVSELIDSACADFGRHDRRCVGHPDYSSRRSPGEGAHSTGCPSADPGPITNVAPGVPWSIDSFDRRPHRGTPRRVLTGAPSPSHLHCEGNCPTCVTASAPMMVRYWGQ